MPNCDCCQSIIPRDDPKPVTLTFEQIAGIHHAMDQADHGEVLRIEPTRLR